MTALTMKGMSKLNPEELEKYRAEATRMRQTHVVRLIDDVKTYYHKRVKVVKGRKVSRGIEGTCFWMNEDEYRFAGGPWGVTYTVRIGIKDDEGNVYWTALTNVELAS